MKARLNYVPMVPCFEGYLNDISGTSHGGVFPFPNMIIGFLAIASSLRIQTLMLNKLKETHLVRSGPGVTIVDARD